VVPPSKLALAVAQSRIDLCTNTATVSAIRMLSRSAPLNPADVRTPSAIRNRREIGHRVNRLARACARDQQPRLLEAPFPVSRGFGKALQLG
jgi:hypothetical protein